MSILLQNKYFLTSRHSNSRREKPKFDFAAFNRELLTGEKRYLIGLDQLAIAATQVGALQKALEVLQPKLAAGAAAVAETTAKVEKEKEGVALIEADVLIDQAAAEEQVWYP